MTYKQIEAAREARLWIGQIVVPVVTTIGALMLVPEARENAVAIATNVRDRIKAKFKK